MDAKISVVAICVKVIMYLLLCNLHSCTFKYLMSTCTKPMATKHGKVIDSP